MNNVKLFQAHKDPVRGLRYPHLCHRPLSIIIVTTIIIPTTFHLAQPCLIVWEVHHGCQRFSNRRCSCLSWVSSVSHSSWNQGIGLSFLSWTSLPVSLLCGKGICSAILTLYFTTKFIQFISKSEIWCYSILSWTPIQTVQFGSFKFLIFNLRLYIFLINFLLLNLTHIIKFFVIIANFYLPSIVDFTQRLFSRNLRSNYVHLHLDFLT